MHKDRNGTERVDFNAFLSGLMAEALVAMGIVKNPLTGKNSKNMGHARIVIDTIEMLKDKTKGNLSADEDGNITNVLHQLRMMFVSGLEDRGSAEKRTKEEET
ncbi:MAG: DUF1844 domain-containing protein [Candidatus Omnitrophica bacterium]|jgi:hypothetical protein|nr:DUF1844 domain-containing protein [Candidatus Omnitrophota bacterium]